MQSFTQFLNESRRTFKKSRNPGTNQGAGTRGKVQFDITAPNEELADTMEAELVELGYESAEYGDDLGSDGYLFSIVVDSRDLKDFNADYKMLKTKLSR